MGLLFTFHYLYVTVRRLGSVARLSAKTRKWDQETANLTARGIK